MARRRIEWDPVQLRHMRMTSKMSYPEIGRVLGVHHTTVMLRCWSFGIEPRPERRREIIPQPETIDQSATWSSLLSQTSRGTR